MKKKTKKISHLLCECPFCGYPCDARSALSWCSGCYTEYTTTRTGTVWFDTERKTERFAIAKAFQKTGGVGIGEVQDADCQQENE